MSSKREAYEKAMQEVDEGFIDWRADDPGAVTPAEAASAIRALVAEQDERIKELGEAAKTHDYIANKCARLSIEKQDWKTSTEDKNSALLAVLEENQQLQSKLAEAERRIESSPKVWLYEMHGFIHASDEEPTEGPLINVRQVHAVAVSSAEGCCGPVAVEKHGPEWFSKCTTCGRVTDIHKEEPDAK